MKIQDLCIDKVFLEDRSGCEGGPILASLFLSAPDLVSGAMDAVRLLAKPL